LNSDVFAECGVLSNSREGEMPTEYKSIKEAGTQNHLLAFYTILCVNSYKINRTNSCEYKTIIFTRPQFNSFNGLKIQFITADIRL
jgi:hypothetical protein